MATYTTTTGTKAVPVINFTQSDINGWLLVTAQIPSNPFFAEAILGRVSMHATSVAATLQYGVDNRLCSYTIIDRGNNFVTPRVYAPLYTSSLGGNVDTELIPVCFWDFPFKVPVRPLDKIGFLVPGDADATPTQDWAFELECLPLR